MLMTRIRAALADRLLDWLAAATAIRLPDVRIGPRATPSLLRWFLWKRRRWWCNLYFHEMLRDDDDRALHDHPWWSLSFVLSDYLAEVYQEQPPAGPTRYRRFRKGQLVLRRPHSAHRLVVSTNRVAYTLFLTGPYVREWGFHCPQGWRRWQDYAKPDAAGHSSGEIGRGCS